MTLPDRDGVGASHVQVTVGPWANALEFLVARFPGIDVDQWRQRFDQGRVLAADGGVLDAHAAVRPGTDLYYYRQIEAEPRIPFEAEVLFRDEQLLVADKPHFLPVMPSGRYVRESLLVRLRHALDLPALAPLHRIDRDTAGLVLFSTDARNRAAYQALFARREVHKVYEALAPWRADLALPCERHSRLQPGEPFFRTQEVAGEPNSLTRIELVERRGERALYRLFPHTGRKHQLRVHMAALGIPIHNDPLYPLLRPVAADDFGAPLQLLARALAFRDPLDGRMRRFESRRSLT